MRPAARPQTAARAALRPANAARPGSGAGVSVGSGDSSGGAVSSGGTVSSGTVPRGTPRDQRFPPRATLLPPGSGSSALACSGRSEKSIMIESIQLTARRGMAAPTFHFQNKLNIIYTIFAAFSQVSARFRRALRGRLRAAGEFHKLFTKNFPLGLDNLRKCGIVRCVSTLVF